MLAIAATGTGRMLLLLLITAVIGGTSPSSLGASPASEEAIADIPADYLALYQQAGADRGIDWAILAAIGKVECYHGRTELAGCNPPGTINPAGARGPMQFLGSTWRASHAPTGIDVSGPAVPEGDERHGYATDGDRNGTADPWSAADAIHGAARFLVRNGAPDFQAALLAYNDDDRYAASVLDYAARYRAPDIRTVAGLAATNSDGSLGRVACSQGGTTTVHAQLGVTAHWLRHTTLTDVERISGIRVAAAYAGHSDTGFGVTGRYTKVSPDELRAAHARLFFDDPAEAGDPTVPPLLYRRVLLAATAPVSFTPS